MQRDTGQDGGARRAQGGAFIGLVTCLALGACSPDGAGDMGRGGWLPGGADGFGDGGAWTAERNWSEQDEEAWSAWVERLGSARAEGRCSTLASCLQAPAANSLYDERDAGLEVFADCADLPYVLRAYFAFKRRLPFVFVGAISGERYTTGNAPIEDRDWRDYDSFGQLARSVSERVHSGFFRLSPHVEGGDTYPVAVDRRTVRPGTTYYDPNGHVLVVYAVEADGTVRLMDGHPDNSLTVARFGEALSRGSASNGGGFRALRPFAIDARGRVLRASNDESPGASATDQYQSSYRVDGRVVGYHEWVRSRLATAGVDPVAQFGEMLDGICNSIEERVGAVQSALDAGLDRQPHPGELPESIYATEGPWETYSSPSRDVRLRAAFRELYRHVQDTVEGLDARDGTVRYDGTPEALVAEYLAIWRDAAANECVIAYDDSDGQPVALDLDDVMDRIYDLSFDPYHCPELRWGAASASTSRPDLQSCPHDQDKLWWFEAEESLRHRIDRGEDTSTPLYSGPARPEDIHVRALLESFADGAGLAFVGTPCDGAEDCVGLPGGFCLAFPGGGFCSVGCDLYCPDRDGFPTTFCIWGGEAAAADASALGGALSGGICVPQEDPDFGGCEDIDGTTPQTLPRNGQPERTARVCAP